MKSSVHFVCTVAAALLSLLVFQQIHGELVGSDALEVKLNLLKTNKTEIYFNCLCCGSTFSHSLSLRASQRNLI